MFIYVTNLQFSSWLGATMPKAASAPISQHSVMVALYKIA